MQIVQLSALVVFLFLASATARADEEPVLSREPPTGALHTGQKALVDDGTCPKGQVKEMTIAETGTKGTIRQRRCVPDPRGKQ